MITVNSLLSHPLFHNFQLISGRSGLSHEVTGTGIFEWESSYDIDRTFEQGEFVMTTLSQAKNDPAFAESCIELLIQKRVSAVAVKSIYYHEFSDDLKAYSDFHQVPIFFFSDTFFDDIIFTIKNMLLPNRIPELSYDQEIQLLINSNLSPAEMIESARAINPFFCDHVICAFVSFQQSGNERLTMQGNPPDPLSAACSVIKYQKGYLIIFTAENASDDLEYQILSFLEGAGLRNGTFYIGISSVGTNLAHLGRTIQESLSANCSCRMENEGMRKFAEIGLDQLLLPLKDDYWMIRYYKQQLGKILSYDEVHSAKLLDTLSTYVKSAGDIQLTAKKMFQHSNTIRYRMEKARKLLELEDTPSSFVQIHIIMRLYEIYGLDTKNTI